MTDHTPQEDPQTIQAATNEAIERGLDNADEEWRSAALEILRGVCMEEETFTVDDFRDMVRELPVQTHDNRAMGGVITTAKKLGWIEPTGRSIPSFVGHKVHIQIWKSLLYQQDSKTSSLPLKQRILEYFKKHPNEWIAGVKIEELASKNTNYSASSASRQCRNLNAEGILDRQMHFARSTGRKKTAFYRYVPKP